MDTGLNLIVSENSEMVRQGLQDLAADIPLVGRLGVYRTAQRIVARLKQPGSPITYPVQWDSDKQRRAFFATDGFGAGIPTGRSGEVESAWTLVSLSNGYEINNSEPYASYVFGDISGNGQSLIHQGRWSLMADVVDSEVDDLPDDVSEELRTAIIASGFAPGL